MKTHKTVKYNPAIVREILKAAKGPFLKVPKSKNGFWKWLNSR